MCTRNRNTPLVRRQITACGTDDVTVLELPWMLAYGATALRVMDDMRQRTGQLDQKVHYRFAAVRTDRPGAWNATASNRVANGGSTASTDAACRTARPTWT